MHLASLGSAPLVWKITPWATSEVGLQCSSRRNAHLAALHTNTNKSCPPAPQTDLPKQNRCPTNLQAHFRSFSVFYLRPTPGCWPALLLRPGIPCKTQRRRTLSITNNILRIRKLRNSRLQGRNASLQIIEIAANRLFAILVTSCGWWHLGYWRQ